MLNSESHYKYQLEVKRNINVDINITYMKQTKREYIEYRNGNNGETLMRVLGSIVNNRKKIIFNWYKITKKSDTYWKSKSCILLIKILNPHIRQRELHSLKKILECL